MPTIPIRIMPMNIISSMDILFCENEEYKVVPIMPMLVQTAYAIAIGMMRTAIDKNKILSTMLNTVVKSMGRLVKLISFRKTAQTISKIPAKTR